MIQEASRPGDGQVRIARAIGLHQRPAYGVPQRAGELLFNNQSTAVCAWAAAARNARLSSFRSFIQWPT